MKAGDIFYPRVRVSLAGVAVLGLTSGSFAVAGYVNATTPGAAFTVAEEGAGWYRLAITTSGTAGWHEYVISSPGNYVAPDVWACWLSANDFETIFAAVVRPTATLGSTAVVASSLPLDLIANRYTPVDVSVTDQNGVALDLSGYTTWRFTVWDKTHTGGTALYTLSSGITGSALGVVSWAVPEGAAFYSQITAAITAGTDSVQLYYDMVADQAGDATKSRTVFRGQLTLYRFEGTA